jgi:hypothetical protein
VVYELVHHDKFVVNHELVRGETGPRVAQTMSARRRVPCTNAVMQLVLVPLAHMSLFAPTLSRAFQPRSPAVVSSCLPKLCFLSPRAMMTVRLAAPGQPRVARSPTVSCLGGQPFSQTAVVGQSKSRRPQRTLLLCAGSSSLSSDDLLQIAGLHLHKFAGLGWLLLFEGAVGAALKFCGITLPPSV